MSPRLTAIAATLLALSGPAAAENDPIALAYDPLMECVATLTGPMAAVSCVGIGAAACLEAEEPLGICLAAEYEIWQARLDLLLDAMRSQANEIDAGRPIEAGVPLGTTLSLGQVMWENHRNAECAHVAAIWALHSIADAAEMECRMEITAMRVLWLERQQTVY